MEEKKEHASGESLMLRISGLIIKWRIWVVIVFLLFAGYSLTTISRVEVVEELTDYLPETTETRIGLDLMDEEFKTFGSAQVMVVNITYENALKLAGEMEEIEGISGVSFYDEAEADGDYKDDTLDEYYKDFSALFTLSFDEDEETALSQKAIAGVRSILSGYEAYIYTTVDKDDSAALQEDMKFILALVSVIILAVLLFTSGTYMEIVLFVLTFAMAAVLNVGTNYWFGSVSFVTNAVGIVLQLALAIDYAIIMFHRFMEEHARLGVEEAAVVALSKAIPEIASSSLTTISGMAALMLMQFRLGLDLGRVMAKAIVFSLITVFFFLPALIVFSARAIDRTGHKSFVPDITVWGRIVVKLRFVTLPLYFCLIVLGIIYSSRCPYIYDINSIEAAKMNEYLTSKKRISETFELTNAMAILVPKGDYASEAEIIRRLEAMEEVDTVLGLANIEVDDDGAYVLSDSLTPREFAVVAEQDINTVRLLYFFYAMENDRYSAFTESIDLLRVPVIDMVDFIYEEKEKGAFTFSSGTSQDIDDLYEDMCDAREQLEGEDWSRILFFYKGAVEGEETFALIDGIRSIVGEYYKNSYVVGDATSNQDLSASFSSDNIKISVVTALFVGIILLLTFRSPVIPILLVLTIQSSIWFNFSIPALTGETMFFVSYLIVSAIQMGATIDYAIVITSRYMALRGEMSDKKAAVVRALNEAFPTVVTSGTIMTSAGFIIGVSTSNGTVASLGTTLGKGTLISIFLVMVILPQLLIVFDRLIYRPRLFKAADAQGA